MNRLVLLSALVAVALCAPVHDLDTHWHEYKRVHQKLYEEHEEPVRRVIWETNLKKIRAHNLEADMGQHSYWLGVNEYTDMTNPEFNKVMNGYKGKTNSTSPLFLAPSHVEFPDTVDWRKEGYVTDVKNQGQCGSCWSFSATGSLEGQTFKKTGKLVSLSEQNLVDCSRAQGNNGCEGGLMDFAFTYIKSNNGIDTEESYPYEAEDLKCRFKREDVGATDTGYVDVPHGDEDALMKAVATVGPISIAIDASHSSFQMYKTGVYVERMCSSKQLDHGVLIVGYGTFQGQDYWLVKNSWGPSWGMDGYIMMARNLNNQCGVASQASYPLV